MSQACPNCGKVHDTSVYVSGQQLTCTCGIRFEVRRTDVRSMAPPPKPSTVPARPGVEPPPPPLPSGPEIVVAEPGNGSGVAVEIEKTAVASSSVKQAAGPNATRVAQPATVPGFELLELLGKGGMGEVWRAQQLSLRRPVAVKVLPEKFARDREFVARFDKEATALASLSHPNIVQIIDRGHAGEHYYIVMELVAGINLREKMNAERLAVREALKIGAQVARAIDYAHEQKIVHRDLKPENVLIDNLGHVKIADFGLAGMHGSEHNISLTATAVAMGTVNYMAPEQRRDAKHVDHRADLYSLGVLLYEMLTGELPIGRFKKPSEKVAGLDPRVDDVVDQLLETEPEGRPKRAMEVATLLEEVTPPSSIAPASSRPVAAASSQKPASRVSSFVQEPGAGWKVGVFVLGGLLLFAMGLKFWPADTGPAVPAQPPAWYADTDDELFPTVSAEKERVAVDFEQGTAEAGEELNAHSGVWRLANGTLEAVQYGEAVEGGRLVPRTYVAHRYYSADQFEAAVDVEVEPLPADFPPVDPEKAQRFAELAFRIKDVQVSVFAIPGTDLRLGWRYFTPDGREWSGNSTHDQAELLEDATRVPKGPFRLKLRLTRMQNGDVTAEAFINKARFARKVLPGLGGQVGKMALGCRNLVCRFDNLEFTGQVAERPKKFE